MYLADLQTLEGAGKVSGVSCLQTVIFFDQRVETLAALSEEAGLHSLNLSIVVNVRLVRD